METPLRSTIRAGGIDTVVGALLAVPMLGVGLAAYVYAVEIEAGGWLTVLCSTLCVASVGSAVVFTRALSGPGPRLRVKVTHKMIAFHQRGRPRALFWRDDIEMIAIEQGIVNQAASMSVYGPSRSILDTWQTGWIAKSTPKVIKTLERHGYPHTVRHGAPSPAPAVTELRRPGTAAP